MTVNLTAPDPTDEVSIYHLGQGFYLAGRRCLLNIEVGPGVTQCLVSPGVVNLCLAAELFMKALLTHAGSKPSKTHKLEDLFQSLPDEAQKAIEAQYL